MTLNFFFVFFTPARRSLGLKLSDMRGFEPQIQASTLELELLLLLLFFMTLGLELSDTKVYEP